MGVFPDFQMLPIGSLDGHAQYMSKFNYRYYCASCIRSIESEKRLDKCAYCSGTNLIMLMEKEVKESVPFGVRIVKFVQYMQKAMEKRKSKHAKTFNASQFFQRFSKPREEMPTR